MQVRQATLDDARHIVDIFVSGVSLWQRMDARGKVEDLPYEALSIYERWLHGGAWMSLETGAIWLSHLLSGNGYAYVVEDDGRILAYAEAFYNQELTPMNNHLHLARMIVAEACGDDAHQALAEAILADARSPGRLSVAYPEYDKKLATYYRAYFGASETFRITRYTISAQIGQSFYKSSDYDHSSASSASAKTIAGWVMAIGRLSSPRAHWEAEWREHWRSIPQIAERGKFRQFVNASGHEALVCYHQQLYNPRQANIYCWSPRHLSTQLLVAIRDIGHRLGFRALTLALPDAVIDLLPSEKTKDPNQQVIATVDV